MRARTIVLALLVAGCKKDPPPLPLPSTATADAASPAGRQVTETARSAAPLASGKRPEKAQVALQLGAIVRGARTAWESESPTGGGHAFCDSAIDVPAALPKAEPYQPRAADGADFDSGEKYFKGWRCLGFAVSERIWCQYAYRKGGNYKAPKRGGPDPGPTGWEASIECDLDGDGTTELFSGHGSIDPKTKEPAHDADPIWIAGAH